MGTYILRRLLLLIPTMFMVTLLVFMLVRFIPGSVLDLMVSDMSTAAGLGQDFNVEDLKKALGMDIPVFVQYARWLGKVVQGDLGQSLWTNRPITNELFNRLPISFELGLIALTTALSIAIPIGIFSAIRQDTYADYIGRSIAILAISLPGFWIATIVVVYGSIMLGWSPSMEYIPFTKDPVRNLGQFVVPGVIMGALLSGSTMRMTRTMMLEVLRQDYIRTGWAKGLNERTVIMRHALKNALIPVVTIVGGLFGIMIGGSVVMEQIFALPGMGRYLIEALNRRDYPIISGVNILVATFVLSMNLIVDLTYGWLDPRVKYN
ncbi:MAG: ABC transporter permease [Chloroflexi bacterium]|nr:ABC transporter permease [Chloroflexota bacterium]